MVDVTILVCIYSKDDPVLLEKSLKNLVNINHAKILIVIDGPVPADLNSLAYRYADEVVELPVNQGHGLARRAGMDKVRTEFVAISDADDLSFVSRFTKTRDFLIANPDCGVVSASVLEVWDNGETSVKRISQNKDFWKYRSPVNQQTALIRMSSYIESGGYLDWYHNEDTYLWYRFKSSGWNIGFIDEILAEVKMNEFSLGRRRGFRYFISEVSLRCLMYVNGHISLPCLIKNIIARIATQVLLPKFLLKLIYIWIRRNTK